jgi:hypothetical protein
LVNSSRFELAACRQSSHSEAIKCPTTSRRCIVQHTCYACPPFDTDDSSVCIIMQYIDQPDSQSDSKYAVTSDRACEKGEFWSVGINECDWELRPYIHIGMGFLFKYNHFYQCLKPRRNFIIHSILGVWQRSRSVALSIFSIPCKIDGYLNSSILRLPVFSNPYIRLQR